MWQNVKCEPHAVGGRNGDNRRSKLFMGSRAERKVCSAPRQSPPSLHSLGAGRLINYTTIHKKKKNI